MRVLLTATYSLPHLSGVTVYNRRLGAALAAGGHQVTVLTSRYDRRLPAEEVLEGIRVVRIPVLFRLSKGVAMAGYLPRLRRLVREHDAVVVNLPTTPWESLAVPVCSRFLGRPVIALFHCDVRLPNGLVNRVIDAVVQLSSWAACRLSDRVVAYTEDYARQSPVLRRVGPGNCRYILPPVEMAIDPEGSRVSPIDRQGDGKPAIGLAARLASEKGVHVLLRALPLIRKELPGAHVLFAGEHRRVVGEGGYLRRIERLLKSSDVDWTFLGVLEADEMAAFYRRCSATVLPSVNFTESFGLVQIESMLCGTPVVASDLPGVRVPVQSTGMGRLVPPGDSVALAQAVVDVVRNRARFVRPAESIRRQYSPRVTAGAFIDLFRGELQARRRTRAARELAWRHLREKPAFLSVQRCIEHRHLLEKKPFAGPILDLGCGDGQFAEVLFREPIAYGLDPSPRALAESARRQVRGRTLYEQLLQANGSCIPLLDASVETILCNSVLEHIPDAEGVLRECARILRPGGRLLLTVPTDRFEDNFLLPRLLRPVGMAPLAERYLSWFRGRQQHFHLHSVREWKRMVLAAGLEVLDESPYMSRRATGLFEILHYAGVPNLLIKKLTGRWVIWRWRPRFALLERLVAGLALEHSTRNDSCVLIEAKVRRR